MPKDSRHEPIMLRIPAPKPYNRPPSSESASNQQSDYQPPPHGTNHPGHGLVGSPPEITLRVTKHHCSYCGDILREGRVCQDCGAYVCLQPERFGSGCIFFESVDDKKAFYCYLCDLRKWRNQASPRAPRQSYRFAGFSSRKHQKLTWPIVVVSMTLSNCAERFISEGVASRLRNHYLTSPDNLTIVDVTLIGNGQPAALKKVREGREFLERSTACKIPGNVFVVVDTHANIHNGELQWAGGATNVQTAKASEVVREFVGAEFIEEMGRASDAARSFPPNAQPSQYEDSPYLRGGWRGLFVASCGPAVREHGAYQDLRALVETDTFDFVMAFAAPSTIGAYVSPAVIKSIEAVGIDKTGDLWESLSEAVCRDRDVLVHNSVVVIYRERDGKVESRHIGSHSPPMRAWGYEFTLCGNKNCRPKPYEFSIKDNTSGTKITCMLCNWTSEVVRSKDLKGIFQCLGSNAPNIWWHEYPASVELQRLFISCSERTRGAR